MRISFSYVDSLYFMVHVKNVNDMMYIYMHIKYFHRASISFQNPALPQNVLPGPLFSSSCSSRSNLLESKTSIKCDFEAGHVSHPSKGRIGSVAFFKEFGYFPSFGPLDQAEKKTSENAPKDRTLRTHQDYSCDVCEINDLPRLLYCHTWEAIGMPLLQLAVPGTLTT